jgi:predicted protein tyrosine phosphatase
MLTSVEMQQKFVAFEATICGVTELAGLAGAPVTHVLSILDPAWPEPEAFAAFGAHRRLDLRFHDIIDEQPGMRPPQLDDVSGLLGFARDLAATPDAHLLVHCFKGLSRSAAALTLILAQARPDRPAAEALAEVVRIRPRAWPNLRMIELGDGLLGLDRSLVSAVADWYRQRLAQRPEIASAMVEMGRQRELDLIGADANGVVR